MQFYQVLALSATLSPRYRIDASISLVNYFQDLTENNGEKGLFSLPNIYSFVVFQVSLLISFSFLSIHSIKQQQLFNVLSAYSMYNTEVGYCQGMSEIAGLLLMYMDEEVI